MSAPLEWSFNPWRERPTASALTLAVTAAIALFLWSTGVPPLAVVGLAMATAGSFAPLLVPARCRVDDQGVAHRGAFGWERRAWTEIRRVARVRGGLLVSPFEHPRRFDSFRALLLPMPRVDRPHLTAEVAPHLSRHGLAIV